MASAAPAAAGPFRSAGPRGRFQVVHDRVVVRGAPSTKGSIVSVAQRGETYEGSPLLVDDAPWLRLSEASLREHRICAPAGAEGCWMLIDGRCVGMGELLRRTQAQPKAVAAAPATPEPAAIDARPTGARAEFVVLHERVVRRSAPSTEAAPMQVHRRGELVEGVPCDAGGQPWLQLDTGWMLMDGAAVGLGLLLAPAADIVDDVVAWGQQRRSTPTGSALVWTAETPEELRRMATVARSSVEPLRAWCRHKVALQKLEQAGFIQHQDFTLGADGVADHVLRLLLRRRAGALLSEEPFGGGREPWSEAAFAQFLREQVEPLVPFTCLTIAPEDVTPLRVLILFHGSFVRGDDLALEAETLQKLLPGTAIVLPEAPIVADAANELRVWWEGAGSVARAPPVCLQRAAATAAWAAARYRSAPLILGGFSQGAMLVSQMLRPLLGELQPRGILLLSGLVEPFDLPAKVKALAVHGDADEVVDVALARAAAERLKGSGSFSLEVLNRLGHEISDAVVDRIAKFCEDVAPVAAARRKDDPSWAQEANQAKLLRWVKKISQVITMFDDERFMSHMMHLGMAGLDASCPTLGGGLVRYQLRHPGAGGAHFPADRRGMAILFHGKVHDLRRDSIALAEAYGRLGLSTCVIDYRQKFSQFCVDATIVLEELETTTGDSTSPVIIHARGCGGIHGIHMAIASHSYPAALRRRLRLLVLDGAVGNFRSLPPSPTGCIATDPIGNDEKLKYVGLPVCILGGDDECCGRVLRPTSHFEVLTKAAEVLAADGALPSLTVDAGTSLMPGTDDGRLASELFQAVSDALDGTALHANDVGKAFLSDILSSGDLVDVEELRGFKSEDLLRIGAEVLEAASSDAVVAKLWSLRATADRQALAALVYDCHAPALHRHGGFKADYAGFQQFEGALAMRSGESTEVAAVRERLRGAFELRRLDEQVAELERDRASTLGVSLQQCHEILERAASQWTSDEVWERSRRDAWESGGHPSRAFAMTKAIALEMSVSSARGVGLQGSPAELEGRLNQVFSHWSLHDPSLREKISDAQRHIGNFTGRVRAELKAAEAARAGSPPTQALQAEVSSDLAVLDVQHAIPSHLGAGELSQVLPASVQPETSDCRARADAEVLGNKVDPVRPGRGADAEGGAPIRVVVHIDRDLDLQSTFEVPAGSTVLRVKERLASSDMMGVTRPEEIRLHAVGEGRELADTKVLTGATAELELS